MKKVLDIIKEELKNFFGKKKNIYIIIGIFIVIIISIGIFIGYSLITKRYDYITVEQKMIDASKKYLSSHSELKPTIDNDFLEIDTSSLITDGYLKDLSKLSDDSNCHGVINVYYNEEKLRYTPILECDNYKTKTINDVLLESPVVTSGDGLYTNNIVYFYRGDYVNNYVSFADKLWRLYKFNENNEMYLILADTVNAKNSATIFDDRYNEEIKSDKGRSDYDASRIKETIESIYDSEFKSHSKYLLTYEACKHNRGKEDTDMTGAIECFETTSSKINLLPAYDYLNASRDPLCTTIESKNCTNYNYLSIAKNKWWLLTGTNENTYKVYAVENNGEVFLDYANTKKNLRYVIVLPLDATYKKGNGTMENPYEIYEY